MVVELDLKLVSQCVHTGTKAIFDDASDANSIPEGSVSSKNYLSASQHASKEGEADPGIATMPAPLPLKLDLYLEDEIWFALSFLYSSEF